jgi:hypothetical protein
MYKNCGCRQENEEISSQNQRIMITNVPANQPTKNFVIKLARRPTALFSRALDERLPEALTEEKEENTVTRTIAFG